LICFTNKWYYTFLLSLAFFGGAFNIFDRVIGFTLACDTIAGHYQNEVLDYFQFNFSWGIFNLPDVFVLTGVIGACALYVIFSIIALVKSSKQDKNVKA
jgi:lipoprotein signal peptidase